MRNTENFSYSTDSESTSRASHDLFAAHISEIKAGQIPEFSRIEMDPGSLSKQWQRQTTGFKQDQDIGVSLDNLQLAFKTDSANPQAGVLYINSHGMHFFSWFYETATEGKIKLSHSMMTTPRDGAEAVQAGLLDNIGVFRSMGLTNSQINGLQITVLTIDEALRRDVESLSFINVDYPREMRERSEAHEIFHGWQYWLEAKSGRPHVSGNWIEKQPGFDKVSKWLTDLGQPSNTQYVGREWAAYAVTEDLKRMGFSREETITFLTQYFERIVQEHGVNVLERVGSVSADASVIIDHFKTQLTAEKQKETQHEEGREESGEESGGETGDKTKNLRINKIEIDPEYFRRPGAGGGLLDRGIGASEGAGGVDGSETGLPGEGIDHLAGRGLVESGPMTITPTDEQRLTALPADSTKSLKQSINDKGETVLEALAAVRRIAGIKAIDPSQTRSWEGLAGEVGAIAREALGRTNAAEPVQDKQLFVALQNIAGLETGELNGRQLSWKDRVDIAIKIAVETIEKTESRTSARSAEITQTRGPSPRDLRISW
jgi:hypothetical protein